MAWVKMLLEFRWDGEEYVYETSASDLLHLLKINKDKAVDVITELISNGFCTFQPDFDRGLVIFRLQKAFFNTQITLN